MDSFAARVSTLVEMAGGNSEFARKCDVSEGVVRKWRNGESDPSRTRLITIANAMDVSLCWLATGEGPMRKAEGVTEPAGTAFTAPPSPASVDPDDYCYVPLYDVHASAGHGAVIDEEPVKSRLAFKQAWLRGEMGLTPKDCCLIYVTGDSMEPTLRKGDVVMLDRANTLYIDDGIYCLRFDGGLVIKRVQRINATQIKVMSDNSIYEPYIIGITDAEIVGKVVWAGKRF